MWGATMGIENGSAVIQAFSAVAYISCLRYRVPPPPGREPFLKNIDRLRPMFGDVLRELADEGFYWSLFDHEATLGRIRDLLVWCEQSASPLGSLLIVLQGHGEEFFDREYTGSWDFVFAHHDLEWEWLHTGLSAQTLLGWLERLDDVPDLALICDCCRAHKVLVGSEQWRRIKARAEPDKSRVLITADNGEEHEQPRDGHFCNLLREALRDPAIRDLQEAFQQAYDRRAPRQEPRMDTSLRRFPLPRR
jgi:hypothetical protein